METQKNNIIGYKGTPDTRRYFWEKLLSYKGSYNLIKNNPHPFAQDIANENKTWYSEYLSNYVKAA